MNATSTRKCVGRDKLESALISANHPSGSSDIAVLDRFQRDLIADALDDEALIYYGQLVVRNDVKYVTPFVEAVLRREAVRPGITARLRLRKGVSFHDLQQVKVYVDNARLHVGKHLEREITADAPVCDRIAALVQKIKDMDGNP